uniref:uncharacterized protein LOC120338237 isoform X1 n=1 Tax=Styela clava TaxID=7725 RepID=UPI001939E872|nr:uncharacterized protein LOC120338237 isoform X1 [Styela clava]
MLKNISNFLNKQTILTVRHYCSMLKRSAKVLYQDTDTSLELVLSDGNTEDWKSFLNICEVAFHKDVIYKQMYPDSEQRREFLKYYYEYYYRCAYKNDYGKLAYIQARNLSSNTTNMVGGLTIVNGWNEREHEDPRMAKINEKGWKTYLRRKSWENANIFRKFEKISRTLNRELVYISSFVLLNQYRSIIPAGSWGNQCLKLLLEEYYGRNWKNRSLPFFVTSYGYRARHFTRYPCKLVQVYRCHDGNNFKDTTGEDSLIWAMVFGIDDVGIVKYITEQMYNSSSMDATTHDRCFEDRI